MNLLRDIFPYWPQILALAALMALLQAIRQKRGENNKEEDVSFFRGGQMPAELITSENALAVEEAPMTAAQIAAMVPLKKSGQGAGPPRWLSAEESPFDIPVLDCRPVTTTSLLFTQDKEVAERYVRLTRSDGKEFAEKHPEAAQCVSVLLEYRHDGVPAEGPVFISRCMEEKWNICYYCSALCFVRSWTGDLVYRARMEFTGKESRVVEIEYNSNRICSAIDAIRAVDFLIKTHLYQKMAITPIPATISHDDGEMVSYLFSEYGHAAHFASREDTVDARIVERPAADQ